MDHCLLVKKQLWLTVINVQEQITYFQLKVLEDIQVDYLEIYQNIKFSKNDKRSTKEAGAAGARISRYEGMEAHARTGDVRLRKYGFSN